MIVVRLSVWTLASRLNMTFWAKNVLIEYLEDANGAHKRFVKL